MRLLKFNFDTNESKTASIKKVFFYQHPLLQAHRKICAAVRSEVKIYQPSGIHVITGCTKHPAPGNKFCPEHQGYQSPVLLPSQVSKETRDKLNKQQRMRSELDVDMLFIVESILDKSGEEILVKWENYKQPTWEPLSSMPAFIKSYVENNGLMATSMLCLNGLTKLVIMI